MDLNLEPAMHEPDGLEERTAFTADAYERDLDDEDLALQLADERRDDLIDLMTSCARAVAL